MTDSRGARFRCFVIVALVASVTLSRPAIGQGPLALGKSDFVVAGVQEGAAGATVRKVLGRPERVETLRHPSDPEYHVVNWHYPGIVVDLGEPTRPQVRGVTLTGPRYATARGLRVGDGAERIRRLYGEPSGRYEDDWDYQAPDNNMHVIRVTVQNGKTKSIYIGWLTD
jgi:hypothetical protein